MIPPEQTPPGVEGKQNKSCQQTQTEQKVGKPAKTRQPPPKGAEQIIYEAQKKPQHHGEKKFLTLNIDRKRHQPKRRAKKPPASRALSS